MPYTDDKSGGHTAQNSRYDQRQGIVVDTSLSTVSAISVAETAESISGSTTAGGLMIAGLLVVRVYVNRCAFNVDASHTVAYYLA